MHSTRAFLHLILYSGVMERKSMFYSVKKQTHSPGWVAPLVVAPSHTRKGFGLYP